MVWLAIHLFSVTNSIHCPSRTINLLERKPSEGAHIKVMSRNRRLQCGQITLTAIKCLAIKHSQWEQILSLYQSVKTTDTHNGLVGLHGQRALWLSTQLSGVNIPPTERSSMVYVLPRELSYKMTSPSASTYCRWEDSTVTERNGLKLRPYPWTDGHTIVCAAYRHCFKFLV